MSAADLLAETRSELAQIEQAIHVHPFLDALAAFFDFFASPPEGFEQQARAVIDEGLVGGESPLRAKRAARLLQAYELMFWDAPG